MALAEKLFDEGLNEMRRGRADLAADLFERALNQTRRYPEIFLGLFQARMALGQADRARIALTALQATHPTDPRAWTELGVLELRTDAMQAGALAFATAIALAPGSSYAWAELGLILHLNGGLPRSRTLLSWACLLDPHNARAQANLSAVLISFEIYEAAAHHARLAIDQDPKLVEAHHNLGVALKGLGLPAQARDALQAVLMLSPDHSAARQDLIDLALGEGALDEAWSHIQAAPQHDRAMSPRVAALLWNLGHIDQALGLWRDFEQGAQRADERMAITRALLQALPYGFLAPGEGLTVTRSLLDRMFALKPLKRPKASGKSLYVKKPRPRVGYLSGDMRRHAVARNLAPVLAAHDPTQVEIILYDDVRKPDEVTQACIASVEHHRRVVGLDDDALASSMAQDDLDILVIVAARFDTNRIFLAERRIAPVQISFHDVASSGLAEMDYLIADATLAPRAREEAFSERIVRLPSFYTHEAMNLAPSPGALPMLGGGGPTLACFNNPAKINPRVLALWAKVLEAIPTARLALKYKNHYANAIARQVITEGLGPTILSDRLIFLAADQHTTGEHLAHYQHVDLALDPFPFSGSTTTFESLAMGVPVMTWPGETMVSRWSASILRGIKMDDFIATGEEDYVDRVTHWLNAPHDLARIRDGLRARLHASPLCDPAGRARQLERIYAALVRKALKDHQAAV